MEFDRTRYVAPCVPRLNEIFVKNLLLGWVRETSRNLDTLEENPNMRDCLIKKLSLLIDDGMSEKNGTLLGGALTYHILLKAAYDIHFKRTGSGLPFASKELSDKAVLECVARRNAGGNFDYLIRNLEEKDKVLAKNLNILAESFTDRVNKREVGSVEEALAFLFRGYAAGSRVTYELLKKQKEVYDLEDQFKKS